MVDITWRRLYLSGVRITRQREGDVAGDRFSHVNRESQIVNRKSQRQTQILRCAQDDRRDQMRERSTEKAEGQAIARKSARAGEKALPKAQEPVSFAAVAEGQEKHTCRGLSPGTVRSSRSRRRNERFQASCLSGKTSLRLTILPFQSPASRCQSPCLCLSF